jgi:hypothetical protein
MSDAFTNLVTPMPAVKPGHRNAGIQRIQRFQRPVVRWRLVPSAEIDPGCGDIVKTETLGGS